MYLCRAPVALAGAGSGVALGDETDIAALNRWEKLFWVCVEETNSKARLWMKAGPFLKG